MPVLRVEGSDYDPLSGWGRPFALAIGYAFGRSLVGFGEFYQLQVRHPAASGHLTDLDLVAVGPGMTCYVPGINAFASLSASLSQLGYRNGTPRDTRYGTNRTSDWGVTGRFSLGKERWLSSNWGLGLAGEALFGRIGRPDEPWYDRYDRHYTVKGFSLLASASFNWGMSPAGACGHATKLRVASMGPPSSWTTGWAMNDVAHDRPSRGIDRSSHVEAVGANGAVESVNASQGSHVAAQESPEPPRALAYEMRVLVAMNPGALQLQGQLQYRRPLYSAQAPLLARNAWAVQIGAGLSPVGFSPAIRISVQPLSLLQLWLAYEPQGYFGVCGFARSFPSPSADYGRRWRARRCGCPRRHEDKPREPRRAPALLPWTRRHDHRRTPEHRRIPGPACPARPEAIVKVLIVDDEPLARDWLGRLLKRMPDMRLCGEATSGEEALEKARTLGAEVVLLDIQIPGKDRLAVARELRDTPVVFTTAHSRGEWLG